jgi:hypothetical protein
MSFQIVYSFINILFFKIIKILFANFSIIIKLYKKVVKFTYFQPSPKIFW